MTLSMASTRYPREAPLYVANTTEILGFIPSFFTLGLGLEVRGQGLHEACQAFWTIDSCLSVRQSTTISNFNPAHREGEPNRHGLHLIVHFSSFNGRKYRLNQKFNSAVICTLTVHRQRQGWAWSRQSKSFQTQIDAVSLMRFSDLDHLPALASYQ